MEQTKFQLRCGRSQLESWREAADRVGWPVSVWMRRALAEAAALEAAVAAEEGLRGLVERENAARAAGHACWTPPLDRPGGSDLAGKFKPDPRRR